jgi:hypothetical protein
LSFDRGSGLSPSSVSLPANIGALHVKEVIGAGSKINGGIVEIDPLGKKWSALLA